MAAALAESTQPRPQLAERDATLQRRCLARVHAEIVQVHRTTAAQLIRRTVEDRADGVGWAARGVRLLRAMVPADPQTRPGGRCGVSLPPHVLAVTDAARHLDDVTAEVAWLLDHGAGFLLVRDEPRSALALSQDSYDLYRQRLGPDDPIPRHPPAHSPTACTPSAATTRPAACSMKPGSLPPRTTANTQ